MKPDVLITWPSGCDYPLCRLQLKLYKKYFNQIIICFYEHGVPDMREFIKQSMPDAVFLESPEYSVAWRETAVNMMLDVSKSDRVLFTEQDFFAKDDLFYANVLGLKPDADIIGIRQGTRLHPCFLLTKRELIDKTSRDFSVKGQDQDHFYQFSRELLIIGKMTELKDLDLFPGRDWYHMSSLTWNLFRIKDANVKEMHSLPDFLVYNHYSRTKKVAQDEKWLLFTYYAEALLTEFGKFLNQK